MITRRPAKERGHNQFGWLDTWHTFSFGEYHDPAHMGFGPLRVINDDTIAGGGGFGTHPHRDMEIITVVYDGVLAHKDSTGASGVIEPGDVQAMTAGTGIAHSEVNPSPDKSVHLLQIWIMPSKRGLTPHYGQKRFETKPDALQAVASPDGRDGSLVINQDAAVYRVSLRAGARIDHELAAGRKAWVQVARGSANVNGLALSQGDGAAIEAEPAVTLTTDDQAELLLFDMA
jgi:redox-sensitive bicupin YhaK (pirin superfamily)